MKIFLLFLASLVLGLTAQAQTNVASANTNAAGTLFNSAAASGLTNRIEIFSDSAEFLVETNIAIYTGNVRAFYTDTKLTCDVLTLHVPKGGERPDYMVADRNVVIDTKDKGGRPMHATGDKAVYTYSNENGVTNEVMVLSGDAFIRSDNGSTMKGDPVIWNLSKGTVNVVSPHMVIQQIPKEASTNKHPASVIQTNTP